MIGTVIKLCRVWKAVPKGIMSRGFPSAILVNATSWECSKGISSKLAQTSTWTEGWMFLRIWVFLFTTTKRKTTQMSARGFTAGLPHRSAPGETLIPPVRRVSPQELAAMTWTLQHHLTPNLVYLFSTHQKTVVAGTLTVHAEPLATNALPRTLKSQ